jgi:hypothetical protein
MLPAGYDENLEAWHDSFGARKTAFTRKRDCHCETNFPGVCLSYAVDSVPLLRLVQADKFEGSGESVFLSPRCFIPYNFETTSTASVLPA